MPEVLPFKHPVTRDGVVIGHVYGWENLKKGDVGAFVEAAGSKLSVQVTRAAVSQQGECVIEGRHEPESQPAPLHSPFGTELHFRNGNVIETIADVVRDIRPRVVDGDDKPFTVTIMVLL